MRCLFRPTINSTGNWFILGVEIREKKHQSPAMRWCMRRQEAFILFYVFFFLERTSSFSAGHSTAFATTSAPIRWQIYLQTPGPQPSLSLGNSGTRALGLHVCHIWVIKYWQTTPNKTKTVSHRALVKTQKASGSFVWTGFILLVRDVTRSDVSLHLDWFHMCFKTYPEKRYD